MNRSFVGLLGACLALAVGTGCSSSANSTTDPQARQDVAVSASATPNCTPPFFEAQAQGCDLAGYDFSDSRILFGSFANANLQGANFSGVSLVNVDLSGADLTGANFSGAMIGQGNLRGAIANQTNFKGVVFRSTDMSGATFQSADFSGSHASIEPIQDDFSSPYFTPPTNFSQSDLNGATITNSTWIGANLSEALLTNLQNSSDALWMEANLTGAVTTGTNLSLINVEEGTCPNGDPLPNGAYNC